MQFFARRACFISVVLSSTCMHHARIITCICIWVVFEGGGFSQRERDFSLQCMSHELEWEAEEDCLPCINVYDLGSEFFGVVYE